MFYIDEASTAASPGATASPDRLASVVLVGLPSTDAVDAPYRYALSLYDLDATVESRFGYGGRRRRRARRERESASQQNQELLMLGDGRLLCSGGLVLHVSRDLLPEKNAN